MTTVTNTYNNLWTAQSKMSEILLQHFATHSVSLLASGLQSTVS